MRFATDVTSNVQTQAYSGSRIRADLCDDPPLHKAVMLADTKALEELLASDIDLDQRDTVKLCAVHVAVSLGKPQHLKLLLDKGM